MSKVRISELIDKEREMGMTLGPFERHYLMETRCPEKVRQYLLWAQKHPHLVMARQGFTSIDSEVPTAAFNARNTFTSETNIIGDTISGTTPQAMLNQFCAIAPNDAKPGKVYQMQFGGIYSNTSTPTMIFTPRWGSNPTVATNISLGASGTFTTITATTNLPIYGELTVVIRSAPPGATLGTCYANGTVDLGIPVTSSQFASTLYWGGGTSSVTIDTTGQGTAGCGLTANLTWGTSSASNTITTQWYFIRSLN